MTNGELRIPSRILYSSFLILNFVMALGCGRKGPPLPPLVRVPAAPADFAAERRGNTVEIKFRVPSNNTDNTRPANIERVDVYAYTAPVNVTAAEVVRRGSKIGTIDVKAPRDPNKTIDPDEPASDLEPLTGAGLDQGATTDVFEELTPDLLPAPGSAGNVDASGAERAPQVEDGRPLVGPTVAVGSRAYAAVGISTSGRPGPFSKVVAVPLFRAPGAPPQPRIAYDEHVIAVTWASDGAGADQAAAPSETLASRPLGLTMPATAFHVYEVGSEHFETRLTTEPLTTPRYDDRRVDWGAHRCYTVRSVQVIAGLSVESEPAPPACETLVDRFPPAPPKGLVAVASEGAINLIWDPAAEKDLAGYLVLRRAASSHDFKAVTPEPILETTFTDKVEPGTGFVYAIEAVDKAGNQSAPSSESTAETAR
jgi:hypothetical protein